jgi:hypothetical protein
LATAFFITFFFATGFFAIFLPVFFTGFLAAFFFEAAGFFFEGVVFVGGSAYLVRTTAIEPHLVTWLASSQVAQYAERVFYRLLGFLL